MNQPPSPRTRSKVTSPRLIFTWLGVLVMVIAAAVIATVQLNKQLYSPQVFVEKYLQHLSDGDGASALSMLERPEVAHQAVLLDGEALSSSMALLEDVQVEQSQNAGEETDVTVQFTVNGEEHLTHLKLTQNGKSWLFFDQWLITNGLGVIEVTNDEPGSSILVNDVAAPLADNKASLNTFLPAAANITSQGEYLAAQAATAVVDQQEQEVPVTLELEPTETLLEEVGTHLKSYLDECAQQKVLQPAGCPLSHQTVERVDADTITWKITSYPEVRLSESGDEWQMPAQSFTAELNYTGVDLMTGEVREQSVEVDSEVEAELTVAPNQFHVQPSVTQEWLEATSSNF